MLRELLDLALVGLKLWTMLSDSGKAKVADVFVEWLDAALREFYRRWK